MAWTASNPVVIGAATKKSDFDSLWDNAQYNRDSVGDFSALVVGTGVTGISVYIRDYTTTGLAWPGANTLAVYNNNVQTVLFDASNDATFANDVIVSSSIGISTSTLTVNSIANTFNLSGSIDARGSDSAALGRSVNWASPGARTFHYAFEGTGGYTFLTRALADVSIWTADRVNGTVASPTALVDGDVIWRVYASGRNPNGTHTSREVIKAVVNGTPSGTTVPIDLHLAVSSLILDSTGDATFTGGVTVAGATVINDDFTVNNAAGQFSIFSRASANTSPLAQAFGVTIENNDTTANNYAILQFMSDTSTTANVIFGQVGCIFTDHTDGSEDSEIYGAGRVAGTMTEFYRATGTSFNIPASANYQIGGVDIIADSAGTTTLSNIDALDATTEATIEAAMDTLPNVTSLTVSGVTTLQIGSNDFPLYIKNTALSHSFTGLTSSDTAIRMYLPTTGATSLRAYSSGDTTPLEFLSYIGSNSPTVPAIRIIGLKWNGSTGATDLADDEEIVGFFDNNTTISILGIYACGTSGASIGIKASLSNPAVVTDRAFIFAKDVSSSAEMFVMDEGGTATQISPHNFSLIGKKSEEMAWAFYSEKDGRAINVDMLKAIRLIERLTGEKLVYIKNEN